MWQTKPVMQNKREFLSQLYSSHKQELSRYACAKFGLDHAASEDAVQQAFAKFSTLETLGDIANPRAYLFRIIHNQIIDGKRRRCAEDTLQEYSITETEYDLPSGRLQGGDGCSLNDPARILAANQELAIMQRSIHAMPELRRKYLKMSRFEHLSNVEIAKRSGISEAAVRKHIKRAILDIKRAIDANKREAI